MQAAAAGCGGRQTGRKRRASRRHGLHQWRRQQPRGAHAAGPPAAALPQEPERARKRLSTSVEDGGLPLLLQLTLALPTVQLLLAVLQQTRQKACGARRMAPRPLQPPPSPPGGWPSLFPAAIARPAPDRLFRGRQGRGPRGRGGGVHGSQPTTSQGGKRAERPCPSRPTSRPVSCGLTLTVYAPEWSPACSRVLSFL